MDLGLLTWPLSPAASHVHRCGGGGSRLVGIHLGTMGGGAKGEIQGGVDGGCGLPVGRGGAKGAPDVHGIGLQRFVGDPLQRPPPLVINVPR